ncbi:hypothetical protein J9303_05120 [Bacillaceae bacterium Marseille-Q3522]|nr:hypothetical protein [Bacillaceae bacterium Marseille-Q3522]
MNWKSFFTGLTIGFTGGYVVKTILEEKKEFSADKVLNNAKNLFKKQGPISGSWINMQKEPYMKGTLHYEVYKGGISRYIDGATEHFEFIGDARTGAILDAYKLS